MSEVAKLSIVSDLNENQVQFVSEKLTVGERLAMARSNQELSIEQIAGQLKWSPRQISEIEAGNYLVFPDMLSVRGFVRTYAKFLKIDSAPLMDELTIEFAKIPVKSIDRPKLDTPFPTGRMPWRHNNSPQKILAALVLVLLCVVAGFVYRTELIGMLRGSAPVKSGNQAEIGSVPQAAPVLPVDVATTSAVVSPAIAPAGEEQKSVPEVPSVEANHAGTSQPGDALAVDGKASTQNNADVSLADSLTLNFRQDSWVQVKRPDGSVLISHLYKAGTQESIAVGEQLNVVIGNAPGVEARLRGQNLVLHAQDGSNVVNLSVK